jgi:hypothetical protein
MPIIFHCPGCGREIRVRSAFAGKTGRCVSCNTPLVVPDFAKPTPDIHNLSDSRKLSGTEGFSEDAGDNLN